MSGDNLKGSSYAAYMADGGPLIRLHVEYKSPIEVGDFVGVFTALASQYDKYVKQARPDLAPDATIYVKQVKSGSIEADLLPWAIASLPVAIAVMDQIQIVETFVRTYGSRLGAYFSEDGRAPSASRSDLRDFMDQVGAIARDPNASSRIEAVAFENGKEEIKAAINFNTKQARVARDEIEKHKIELERGEAAEFERVLMVFSQSNIKTTEPGRRTGERVIISDISDRELPLIYASAIAEGRIKHEIREENDNVFKKGFVVDVNVQMRNEKPVAYRVSNVHQIIDLPD